MDYFYAPPEKISKTEIHIEGEEFNHLVHVMRKKAGDDIRVVDGCGHAYDGILTALKKRIAVARISSRFERLNEPDVSLDLAAGILKNPAKFDFLVEKVTELGVRRIIPLTTERTIPRHAKPERWRRLALAAMKQCGRSVLPHVDQLRSLADILGTVGRYDSGFMCHEAVEVGKTFGPLVREAGKKSVLILIGPEGGFSPEEVSASLKAGCSLASLGRRRLRTETAAIVAATIVLQER